MTVQLRNVALVQQRLPFNLQLMALRLKIAHQERQIKISLKRNLKIHLMSIRFLVKGVIKSNNISVSIRNLCNGRPKMAENIYTGVLLSTILKGLKEYAPLELAESWDNVGLLVDPIEAVPIRRILLTNDLTEEVVNEAVSHRAGLIITYHPNIFQGLKSITSRSWKERIVVNCIKNNIAVFSPHTSWDAVLGGVNDWLLSSFPVTKKEPIIPHADNVLVGAGRYATLPQSMSLSDAIQFIKAHIDIPHLRLALAKDKNESSAISSVAVCAGSGGSVFKHRPLNADLYLTGEMSHHDVLDLTQNGSHVILCEHSNSERGFLKVLQGKLQHEILSNKVEVLVSAVDRDPLKVV